MSVVINCPACKTRLTISAATAAEGWLECPNCEAAVRVPTAGAPPRPSPPPARPAPPAPAPLADYDEDEPRSRRRRRRTEDDEDSRSRPFKRRFPCPNCSSEEVPLIRTRISTTGWIVFALLLIFTVCFFWIGLLIKEQYRVCPECGAELP